MCHTLSVIFVCNTLWMTKIKRKKSFEVHWIPFKCKENFCIQLFWKCCRKPLFKRFIGKTFVFCWKSMKTAKLFSCLTFIIYCIPGNTNNIADAISLSGCLLQVTRSGGCNNTRKHPGMSNPGLHNHLMQFRYHGVTKLTCWTYQSELIAYTFLLSF